MGPIFQVLKHLALKEVLHHNALKAHSAIFRYSDDST